MDDGRWQYPRFHEGVHLLLEFGAFSKELPSVNAQFHSDVVLEELLIVLLHQILDIADRATLEFLKFIEISFQFMLGKESKKLV